MSDGQVVFAAYGIRVAARAKTARRMLVEDVSLSLRAGECLGIVGESGSGKSLTLRSLIGLLPPGTTAVAGRYEWAFGNQPGLTAYRPRRIRGHGIGMVFQEPMRALDPRVRCGEVVIETIRTHGRSTRRGAVEQTNRLLRECGIEDAERVAHSYPHQLSGGLRQRVLIAAALSGDPKVLLCDEPTTALDVTTQAQILRLLRRLMSSRGLALVFVSHDLGVIANIADRVQVMYAGRVVESGSVDRVMGHPMHPYTERLMASIPHIDDDPRPLATIPGMAPAVGARIDGCAFARRCAFSESKCVQTEMPLVELPAGQATTCRRWEELPALLGFS
jgi:oligopeptide/dipeptide ABC transporter ATP-binding protein